MTRKTSAPTYTAKLISGCMKDSMMAARYIQGPVLHRVLILWEIAQQLDEFDSVIVPVGGGGLISGISIAIKSLKPPARVYGVEPTGAAKMQASLSAGRIVAVQDPKSIADGLIPATVGDLTLEACQKNVDGMFSVTDDEILSSMKLLMQDAHIFPEPSGSAPLAVLSKAEESCKLGDRVVLVISGGNVSLSLLNRLLS